MRTVCSGGNDDRLAEHDGQSSKDEHWRQPCTHAVASAQRRSCRSPCLPAPLPACAPSWPSALPCGCSWGRRLAGWPSSSCRQAGGGRMAHAGLGLSLHRRMPCTLGCGAACAAQLGSPPCPHTPPACLPACPPPLLTLCRCTPAPLSGRAACTTEGGGACWSAAGRRWSSIPVGGWQGGGGGACMVTAWQPLEAPEGGGSAGRWFTARGGGEQSAGEQSSRCW